MHVVRPAAQQSTRNLDCAVGDYVLPYFMKKHRLSPERLWHRHVLPSSLGVACSNGTSSLKRVSQIPSGRT
jgi:hypothetical protein